MPDESEVSMRLMDRILYVRSDYHAISQIIFSGEDHTYVYDLSDKLIFSKKMMLVNQEMAVPLTVNERINLVVKPEFTSVQLSPLSADRNTPLPQVPAKMVVPLTAND